MRMLLFPFLVLVGCGDSATQPAQPAPDLRTRTSGSDWPSFLGPTGDSVSSEKGEFLFGPSKQPKVLWDLKLGTGYAMPAISRGRLFQFDREGDKCRLRCLKSEIGTKLWQFEYPTDYKDKFGYNNGPRCSPIVDGEQVYLHGPEGMLHCLNIADGKPLWKVDTRTEFNLVPNFFGVGSTPIIEGDLLLVQVGGSPKGSNEEEFENLKGNGTGVVAFDKNTGKVRYKISDELASYASPVLATMHGRRWCFLFARGGLLAFEPASGKIDFHFKWRSPDLESVNASNPVVVGDHVLLTECYGPGGVLLKIKKEGNPEVVWSDADKRRGKSLACHWMTPIHHDGYVYGSSGRHTQTAELHCVELATGKVMWSQSRLTRSSLLMVNGHFLCLGEDGTLMLLKVNPKRFEQIAEFELRDKKGEPLLDYPGWAAPIVSHGLLYLRGNDRLVCVEMFAEKK